MQTLARFFYPSVLLLVVVISSRIPFAQEVPEFRVESKQVLVPVVVSNFSGDEPSDLAEKDFHLFEDGKEQRIRLTLLRFDTRDFRDNLGGGADLYSYYSTRAKWTTTFVAPPYKGDLVYLLTYVPASSPEGSCHQIELKTSRRAWFAFAVVNEYCNTRHPTYDTFNGTALNKKMEQYAASGKTGKIGLALRANFTYAGSNSARADIVLEFPAGMEFANKNNRPDYGIQVLGLLYRKDGSVAARFSDRRECFPLTWLGQDELDLWLQTEFWCKPITPYRYEVQLDVPSGEYETRAVVSDGKNFGMANMPLVIENFNGKQLAISGIALCKRFHAFPDSHPHALLPHANLAREVIFPTDMIPLVSKGIEFTPVADTHFEKTDPLMAYFEIYEPLLASHTPPKVQVHLRIVESKTAIVRDDFQPVDVAPYIEGSNSTIHVSRKIPLDKLAAGSYRLEVQAVDSAGGITSWQSADFAVN